ncbi:hypothetical protein BD311DRAFT_754447 [Dichomitus squalens]|uniref:Uncharacterized protein n=1 Tax=Dichomitus squalens TaxID=114155 RepID=A0A4Q9MV39_9APHY|nr:hypothetical protein BD311DRAFT_754447 [Dichomitus squalens]
MNSATDHNGVVHPSHCHCYQGPTRFDTRWAQVLRQLHRRSTMINEKIYGILPHGLLAHYSVNCILNMVSVVLAPARNRFWGKTFSLLVVSALKDHTIACALPRGTHTLLCLLATVKSRPAVSRANKFVAELGRGLHVPVGCDLVTHICYDRQHSTVAVESSVPQTALVCIISGC